MGEKGKETIEKTIRSGRVRAICTSERRGTEKHAVSEARFEKGYGIRGDAHVGNWHRQVSLLSYDKVKEFNERGAKVVDGAFGENLVVEDLDFRSFPVGTILECEDVVLKMTQIGKECHTHCQIYQRMGECIMPVQGVFAEVLVSGTIHADSVMTARFPDGTEPFTAAVITMSDKGSKGERADESGPAMKARLKAAGFDVVEALLLPDEKELLKRELVKAFGSASGRSHFDKRRHGIFRPGYNTGGDIGSDDTECAGNCGGNPGRVHEVYKKSDVI